MCDVGRCKQLPVIQYAAFGPRRNKVVEVCDKHWEQHCDEVDKFDLRTYFYPKDRSINEGAVRFLGPKCISRISER